MPDPKRRGHPRAVVGLIANLIVPGLGTLLVGKVAMGAAQLAIFLASVFMNLTGTMAAIGVPAWLGVWMWALITSVAASGAPPDA